MRFIIIILAVCSFQANTFSQDTVVVEVKLKDSRYDDPIRNAEITFKNGGSTTVKKTNSSGVAYFLATKKSKEKSKGTGINFTLKHPKYHTENFNRRISSRMKRDTLRYQFEMDFMREQYLAEVVVPAPGVPVVQYGSERLHVSDFEILNNGDLLLLTYPKNLKKSNELLVWDGKNVKSSFTVPHRAEELVRDFRGNPHVICENAVYGVMVSQNEVGLMTLEKDYFLKYVAPIVDTNKSKMYFSNFNEIYPAFDYFSFDRIDSTYTTILEIEDELMMELYRSEYKWVDIRAKLWAKNKEIQTGVDAEIWVGANYFTQSIYYKELYAPLFHRNDTLFVFDYYKDFLRTFDSYGNKLDSTPVYHHYDKRSTGWQSNLIQDRKTGQIYATFDRAGYSYIGWVDTKTGEITEQVKLEYRYAHSIQVYGNHLYYIYRPYESPQKKYLYKERLPYSFGKAKTLDGQLVSQENKQDVVVEQ